VAKRFGTQHQEFIVEPQIQELLPKIARHFGEPYADSSAIPTFYLAQMTSRYVKVALNGDGGDEAFVGYKHHLASLLAERFTRSGLVKNRLLSEGIRRFTAKANYNSATGHINRFLKASSLPAGLRYKRWVCFYDDEMKRRLYSKEFLRRLGEESSVDLYPDVFNRNSSLHIVDASLLADISIYLPSDLLVKMDISSMANSLETRSPFLDRYVMEFMASVPVSLKMKNYKLKYLFKSSLKHILPREILSRDKRGFAVPISFWLKHELNTYFAEAFFSDRSGMAEIFNMDYIRHLFDEHIRSRRDHAHYLWIMLMLKLWCDEYGMRF
jgi:asparagine synthase (glutamine-hydrolysing)